MTDSVLTNPYRSSADEGGPGRGAAAAAVAGAVVVLVSAPAAAHAETDDGWGEFTGDTIVFSDDVEESLSDPGTGIDGGLFTVDAVTGPVASTTVPEMTDPVGPVVVDPADDHHVHVDPVVEFPTLPDTTGGPPVGEAADTVTDGDPSTAGTAPSTPLPEVTDPIEPVVVTGPADDAHVHVDPATDAPAVLGTDGEPPVTEELGDTEPGADDTDDTTPAPATTGDLPVDVTTTPTPIVVEPATTPTGNPDDDTEPGTAAQGTGPTGEEGLTTDLDAFPRSASTASEADDPGEPGGVPVDGRTGSPTGGAVPGGTDSGSTPSETDEEAEQEIEDPWLEDDGDLESIALHSAAQIPSIPPDPTRASVLEYLSTEKGGQALEDLLNSEYDATTEEGFADAISDACNQLRMLAICSSPLSPERAAELFPDDPAAQHTARYGPSGFTAPELSCILVRYTNGCAAVVNVALGTSGGFEGEGWYEGLTPDVLADATDLWILHGHPFGPWSTAGLSDGDHESAESFAPYVEELGYRGDLPHIASVNYLDGTVVGGQPDPDDPPYYRRAQVLAAGPGAVSDVLGFDSLGEMPTAETEGGDRVDIVPAGTVEAMEEETQRILAASPEELQAIIEAQQADLGQPVEPVPDGVAVVDTDTTPPPSAPAPGALPGGAGGGAVPSGAVDPWLEDDLDLPAIPLRRDTDAGSVERDPTRAAVLEHLSTEAGGQALRDLWDSEYDATTEEGFAHAISDACNQLRMLAICSSPLSPERAAELFPDDPAAQHTARYGPSGFTAPELSCILVRYTNGCAAVVNVALGTSGSFGEGDGWYEGLTPASLAGATDVWVLHGHGFAPWWTAGLSDGDHESAESLAPYVEDLGYRGDLPHIASVNHLDGTVVGGQPTPGTPFYGSGRVLAGGPGRVADVLDFESLGEVRTREINRSGRLDIVPDGTTAAIEARTRAILGASPEELQTIIRDQQADLGRAIEPAGTTADGAGAAGRTPTAAGPGPVDRRSDGSSAATSPAEGASPADTSVPEGAGVVYRGRFEPVTDPLRDVFPHGNAPSAELPVDPGPTGGTRIDPSGFDPNRGQDEAEASADGSEAVTSFPGRDAQLEELLPGVFTSPLGREEEPGPGTAPRPGGVQPSPALIDPFAPDAYRPQAEPWGDPRTQQAPAVRTPSTSPSVVELQVRGDAPPPAPAGPVPAAEREFTLDAGAAVVGQGTVTTTPRTTPRPADDPFTTAALDGTVDASAALVPSGGSATLIPARPTYDGTNGDVVVEWEQAEPATTPPAAPHAARPQEPREERNPLQQAGDWLGRNVLDPALQAAGRTVLGVQPLDGVMGFGVTRYEVTTPRGVGRYDQHGILLETVSGSDLPATLDPRALFTRGLGSGAARPAAPGSVPAPVAPIRLPL